MPRRDNENNPLQWQVHTVSVPKGTTPVTLTRRLVQYIDNGTPIPSTWSVDLGYRNPRSRGALSHNWQWGSFEDVINDSEGWGGFVTIVRDGLVRHLRNMMAKEERMKAQRRVRRVAPPPTKKPRRRK